MSDQLNFLITLVLLACYLIPIIKVFQGILLVFIKGHKAIRVIFLGLVYLLAVHTASDMVYNTPWMILLPVIVAIWTIVTIINPGIDNKPLFS